MSKVAVNSILKPVGYGALPFLKFAFSISD